VQGVQVVEDDGRLGPALRDSGDTTAAIGSNVGMFVGAPAMSVQKRAVAASTLRRWLAVSEAPSRAS
jgi:hypothetical protein